MKPPAFAYHAPATVDDALGLLADLGDDGKVLAGGQSLIPLMNMRLAAPNALVDISRLEELDRIDVSPDSVRIGAAATHERVLRHPAATALVPLLAQALRWVAHPVIRNRGTTVGSVAHADPAAEMPAVLTLLDGWVELASAFGVREVFGRDFFLGPLEADVRAEELATAIVVPRLPAHTGTACLELARRHGDYALVGVATRVTLDQGVVSEARAVFFGTGTRPDAVDLTTELAGQHPHRLRLGAAMSAAQAVLAPTADIHASADYRRHVAGVLLGRGLVEAAGSIQWGPR